MHPTAPGPGTPTSVAIETPTPGETAQQRQTRRSRAIPRSPGSRAEETSGAWTGWRNLQVLEGGRRKPKGWAGFPAASPPPPRYLSKSVSSSPSLPSGQSHPPQRRAEAQPGSKGQTREIKRGWRSRGSLAGTGQPSAQPSQRSRCHSSCLRCCSKFASSLALELPALGSREEQHLSAWFVHLLAPGTLRC